MVSSTDSVLKKISVLLVEDDAIDADWAERALLLDPEFAGSIVRAESEGGALSLLESDSYDAIILDLRLPDGEGLDLFERVKSAARETPIILLTGTFNEETSAVMTLKRGAQDYLYKDSVTPARLRQAIVYAVERQALMLQLDHKTLELDKFTARVVHDLKSPLSSIAGFVEVLKLNGKLLDNEEGRECVEWIANGTRKMKGMIDAMLNYSKLGGEITEVKPFSLDDCLSSALENLNASIAEKGALIQKESLPHALGEASLIEQVFQNLIGNALKFAEEQSPVVRISSSQAEGEIIISIRDNGIGVPSESRNEIFGFLSRLHGEAKFEGFGIGLATCKRIMESHKGRIWVAPTEGKGATFCFSLPRADSVGS